jgi:hypothetical protein
MSPFATTSSCMMAVVKSIAKLASVTARLMRGTRPESRPWR